jgi:uncharacterized protein DUF3883
VEIDAAGTASPAGYAPYLDYRPPTESERALLGIEPAASGIEQDNNESVHAPFSILHSSFSEEQALTYAIEHLVPEHVDEVRGRKEELVAKTLIAVRERLTKEIIYWNSQAVRYREQEQAGKTPRMNAAVAERRADDLQERLRRRTEELEQERRLVPQPPVVVGGALVVPTGLLLRLLGQATPTDAGSSPEARRRIELAAMAAVMAAERALGFEPRDVSGAKIGYDVESRILDTGKLRFIEVKGRAAGAEIVTVTRNEILYALNKPDDFILALVEVDSTTTMRYIRSPFTREPDFGVESVNYGWRELWDRGAAPE